MNRTTRFGAGARIDYREAVGWYELRQPGLGDRFGIAISRAIERIIFNPELFRTTPYSMNGQVVRRVVVTSFPFVIYFYTTADEIVIVAIFHTSRNVRRLLDRAED